MKSSLTQYFSFVCIITIFITIMFSGFYSVFASEKDEEDINSSAGIMLCTENGSVLYSQNADKGFIPASTIKVLTSLVALHYLGEDYKFETCFFLSPNIGSKNILKSNINSLSNKNVDSSNGKDFNLPPDIKIKGYGDPLFTSSVIHDACRQLGATLKSMNIKSINDIVIDNSFFSPHIEIDGKSNSNNPYDAFNGALSANFNSASFKYNKAKREYISDDPEIPLLPIVINRVKSSWLKEGRVLLSEQESEIYAGMLIQYFLLQDGFTIKGSVKTGIATKNDKLIYKFISPYGLDEIIRRLLKYSSNFMSNQLFLSAGAKVFSPPATVEKGVAAMNQYAGKFLGIAKSIFKEGAGLSRKNKIYPEDMMKILKKFRPHYQLMKTEDMLYYNSFSGVEYYKTGTLNGVKTRCGYFQTPKGLYPFVIMVNQHGVGYKDIRETLWKIVSKENRTI